MFKMVKVESSNISAIGFETNAINIEKTGLIIGILRIKFVYGAIYDYENVPKLLFDDFVKAESVGKFFHNNIRNNFQGIKIGG